MNISETYNRFQTGRTYSYLTVIGPFFQVQADKPYYPKNKRIWYCVCRCYCGVLYVKRAAEFTRRGQGHSCGCRGRLNGYKNIVVFNDKKRAES